MSFRDTPTEWRAYRGIGLGLLFEGIRVTVAGMEVPPDFIGNLLVAGSALGLARVERRFVPVWALAFFLAAFDLCGLVLDLGALAAPRTLLYAAMVWSLLLAIEARMAAHDIRTLESLARSLRWISVTVSLGVSAVLLSPGSGFGVLAMVPHLACWAGLLALLWAVSVELRGIADAPA